MPLPAGLTQPAQSELSSGAPVTRQHQPALRQHSRLTVILNDATDSAKLAACRKLTNCYDVLAVQPLSDRAFASACTVLDVDVIAIDFCCRRLPFGCAASLRAYRNVPDPLMSDAGCASRCCGRPSAEVSSLSWSIRRCCANRAPGPGFLQMPRSCYNSPAARAFSSAAALDEPPNCEARSRPPA